MAFVQLVLAAEQEHFVHLHPRDRVVNRYSSQKLEVQSVRICPFISPPVKIAGQVSLGSEFRPALAANAAVISQVASVPAFLANPAR